MQASRALISQTPRLPPVERFFQFSLLGLVASGYLAIAGSGYVDLPTVILAGLGLIWRAAIISGARRLQLPDLAVTIATVAYMVFAPIDYFLLSHTWITATVHVVFFVAGVKTLTARVARDYLFVAAVAFLELLAAALFSSSGAFFLCLAAYLLCAVATLSASQVRGMESGDLLVAPAARAGAPSRLALLSAVITAGILALTAGLFFILPRTANAALLFLGSNRYHLTGFSNDVELGAVGELKTDSRPVMHVKALPTAISEATLPQTLKWRGLALERFDGRRWSTDPGSFRTLPPGPSGLIRVADDSERRRPGKRILYRVEIQNVDADALFVAGTPEFLNVGRTRVSRAPSGALRFGFAPSDVVRYEVYSFLPAPGDPAEVHHPSLPAAERAADLKLPMIDSRIAPLARRLTAGARTDDERARLLERRLRHNYAYTLDLPATEPRDPVGDFLFVRRAGYCEHFASAMTVMLRTLGIPARLVNGFQSGILNPYSGTQVIRASDAHTWVEAYLPDRGWTVFDPTPLAGVLPAQTMWTRLSLYLDAADTFWREWVLSYDLGQQLTLAERLESRARRLRQGGFFSDIHWIPGAVHADWKAWGKRLEPFGAVSVAMLLLGGLLWRFRRGLTVRRARQGKLAPREATVLYLQMLDTLKRRGVQKPQWLTAGEFAASVRQSRVLAEGERDVELDRFTAAYHAVRFGGNDGAAPEMAEALEGLGRRAGTR